LDLSLCESFPALTPLSLRREKAREVFNLIERMNDRPKEKENKPKGNTEDTEDTIVRVPAGDNWF